MLRYPDRMKHHPVMRGTRAELRADLEAAAVGWAHLGKPHLAEQAVAAVGRLEAGEFEACVGHITYQAIE